MVTTTSATLFQGQTLASHRQIRRHKFDHSGDTIDELSSHYIVQIKKRKIAEEDPSNTCRDYPNEDFATYMECDDKFMAETYKDTMDGLNVTPPWITNDLNSTTVAPVLWSNFSWTKYGKNNERRIYTFIFYVLMKHFSPDHGSLLWTCRHYQLQYVTICHLPFSLHNLSNGNKICPTNPMEQPALVCNCL